MKRFLKWAALAATAAIAVAIMLAVNVWAFKPIVIDAFYARMFAKFALDRPEMLSNMRLLPAWADFYSGRLDDVSPAFEQKSADLSRHELETLRRYDRTALAPEARHSYDVLEYFLRIQVEGDRFRFHEFALTQMDGVHTEFPKFMAGIHQVAGERDARNYVARLRGFPAKVAQTLDNLKLREQHKMVPPRFALDLIQAQIAAVIAESPRRNPIYTSFEEKLAKIEAESIGADARGRLLADVERALTEDVYPAYRRLAEYMAALQSKTASNHGVWSLPDGAAYYAWCVRRHTTTDASPEELHALGLAEVARISAEMHAILKGHGLVKGSVGARTLQLAQEPAQLYENTPAGRQAVLQRYQQIIDEIDRGIGAAFDLRPKLGVVVEPVPEFAQDGEAAAYYRPGAFDGSRPGVFFANVRDTRETPKFAMRTLAYHEGIPGHHFQIAIAQELRDVAFFRRVIPFTAYAEGWALYAEQLAWELGYQNDPLDNLGRLRDEMLRATRLVVDTGIHHKRWTREQAIEVMVENIGLSRTEAATEVERYFVWPGQALAYKVGMMKILELRAKAKAQLGAKFDLKRFHNEVLRHGSLPLVVLERIVDEWIARVRAAA